ncbi:MAG: tRNA (adenosine(37)-N6)-dimethylallyltransferase MiaA [Nocardioidaceae bacterium]
MVTGEGTGPESAVAVRSVPVVAVVGATAAGKSELALDLAQALGGEVVNTDSMQIYRGMDIGTAKLPANQRRGVPHHLLDLLEVTEPATVAQFQGWARDVVADCRSRGATPVLVGGSALYTRAVLDRFEFPGTDPAVRRRLEDELDQLGAETLHARLAARDPVAASKVLASNGRRIVRALEVVEITSGRGGGGRPGRFSASLPGYSYVYDKVVQIGLDIERQVVDERIARRVGAMWRDGLVDEVRALADRGLREGRTASRALGYRQVLDFLAGTCSEQDAQEATIAGTRRFARRQDSWFRKDPRVRWIGWDGDRLAAALRQMPGRSTG